MTQPPPDTETVKAFNDKIAAEFRANNGKVGAFEGTELLLLTTTGAKSGQPRLSPLSCRPAAAYRACRGAGSPASFGSSPVTGAQTSIRRGYTTCGPTPARMSNWPMS